MKEAVEQAKRIPVSAVMSPNPKTLGPNQVLWEADRLNELHQIRHIPVVDEDGALCGILTDRDVFHGGLLRALGFGQHARQKAAESLLVKEVMHTDVVSIDVGASLADAARAMMNRKIGCLPVLEAGKLVGIVTESDVLRWVTGAADDSNI